MKVKVTTLDNKDSGELTLKKEIFGLPERNDILQRLVRWQLAKRQAGTHKTKVTGEVKGTKSKPFRQKGTGNARQGSKYAAQMRGGSTVFGPVVRSHAHSLPKKIRQLGLKTALSTKFTNKQASIIKDATLKTSKTKELSDKIKKLGLSSALIIDGNDKS